MTSGIFSEAIKELREHYGVTRAYLSKAAGVSHVTMLHVERGKQVLGDQYVKRMAAHFGMDALPLLELAALERGTLSIKQAPEEIQRLICRITHGEPLSAQTAAKLTAILDQEPVAA